MQQNITDDLEALLAVLPPEITVRLREIDRHADLIEIILDLGRRPEARFIDTDIELLDREITEADGSESIVFLHRIVPGGTDKSYGLHVARLAGVPQAVIARGREVLQELERSFARETKTPQLSRRRTRVDPQLLLFADPAEEVAAELEATDVSRLTPQEALAKLKDLQRRLGRT